MTTCTKVYSSEDENIHQKKLEDDINQSLDSKGFYIYQWIKQTDIDFYLELLVSICIIYYPCVWFLAALLILLGPKITNLTE
jgi:hypothetical protein